MTPFATSGAVPSRFGLHSRIALALGHAAVDVDKGSTNMRRTQEQVAAFGSSIQDGTTAVQVDYVDELVKESAKAWDDYIGDSFPKQLAKDTVLLNGFRHYMVQDGLYLEHYYRLRIEAVGKSGDFEEIKKVAAKLAKSLDWVTSFRDDLTDKLGVPKPDVTGEEKSKALLDSIALHEKVLKNGDWLDIHIILLPCILGYYAIATKLLYDSETIRNTIYYPLWILGNTTEVRIHHDFNLRSAEILMTPGFINKSIGNLPKEEREKRWKGWVDNFTKACGTEKAFFDLANPSLNKVPDYNIVKNGSYKIRSYRNNYSLVARPDLSVVTSVVPTEGLWRLTNTLEGYMFESIAGQNGFLTVSDGDLNQPLYPVKVSKDGQQQRWQINTVAVYGDKGLQQAFQVFPPGRSEFVLDAGRDINEPKVFMMNNCQISTLLSSFTGRVAMYSPAGTQAAGGRGMSGECTSARGCADPTYLPCVRALWTGMQSTGKDGSKTTEINAGQHPIYSVFFAEDGKQVWSSGEEGMLRRWRVDDGHEAGEPIKTEGGDIFAAAGSPDGRWLVCGLRRMDASDGKTNVRVWDAQTREKVLDIRGHTDTVFSVDISTKFATGSADKHAFIWHMTTGERLVGPLAYDNSVVAVRFAPNGDRIATATADVKQDALTSIHIYNNDNGQQLLAIPCRFFFRTSSPLAWSADGGQLFAASYSEVKRFDTSSGSLLSKWTVPGSGYANSIALSRNQKRVTIFLGHLRQHDINRTSIVNWIALSPNDDYVATGEENGKITLQSLRDILPVSYLTVNAILHYLWLLSCVAVALYVYQGCRVQTMRQGDLTRVEELLKEEIVHPVNPLRHAHAHAHRALVRSRSKRWDMAIDDAQKSTKVQRSVIGYIAHAIAYLGNGDHESAMRVFDLVYSAGLSSENNLLLLIKAIILFECGKHDDAILRVGDLIDIVDGQSIYITVRAQMFLQLGIMSMRRGDNERAIELFNRAQVAIPFRRGPPLVLISLIFGWDFDRLVPAIQLQLYKAIHAAGHTSMAESRSTIVETLGEDALTSDVTADWDPGNQGRLFQSMGIRGDTCSPACLQQYDEAMDAFTRMLSLIEESPDPDTHRLVKKYVSPTRSDRTITNVVHEYFQYVTLSHVWGGKEPPFQDVSLADSVWELNLSPLNERLRKFCEVVRTDGYRWAWSDTCCIDKTISTVLNQSLTMMCKWYAASAATFILLADVESISAFGNLIDSIWMTRAWTAQELLAAKTIRFYNRDWKPYLGDTPSNHTESPEIMEELTDAIGIARETIISFHPDDLGVRDKLRVASTRKATVEEDMAYSLIGIFKSDIRPHYGEGDVALGHLLEEIVARSGEPTVLDWSGKSSPYNSCLPATLAVYSQNPSVSPLIQDDDMDMLSQSTSGSAAYLQHALLTADSTCHASSSQSKGSVYNVLRVIWRTITVLGLSLTEPRKLIFVHPWIRDLRDPFDGFVWGSTADDDEYDADPELEYLSDSETEFASGPSSPLNAAPAITMDGYTRALRLVVLLQQPFHALLLRQQPNGEFRRVAAEHEIVVPGIERTINFARDVRTEVVEIL
ncbi:WD40 repeat-like protein [Imleria badia]|nr:WD40 repeat-like protein [Imleria badia]